MRMTDTHLFRTAIRVWRAESGRVTRVRAVVIEMPPDDARRLATAAIRDGGGKVVPTGTDGELCIPGPLTIRRSILTAGDIRATCVRWMTTAASPSVAAYGT